MPRHPPAPCRRSPPPVRPPAAAVPIPITSSAGPRRARSPLRDGQHLRPRSLRPPLCRAPGHGGRRLSRRRLSARPGHGQRRRAAAAALPAQVPGAGGGGARAGAAAGGGRFPRPRHRGRGRGAPAAPRGILIPGAAVTGVAVSAHLRAAPRWGGLASPAGPNPSASGVRERARRGPVAIAGSAVPDSKGTVPPGGAAQPLPSRRGAGLPGPGPCLPWGSAETAPGPRGGTDTAAPRPGRERGARGRPSWGKAQRALGCGRVLPRAVADRCGAGGWGTRISLAGGRHREDVGHRHSPSSARSSEEQGASRQGLALAAAAAEGERRSTAAARPFALRWRFQTEMSSEVCAWSGRGAPPGLRVLLG